MTQEQFRARFRWTVDPATACWTDLQGEGAFPDPKYPARVHVYRSEGGPPMKHGGHTLMQRANRLAYETFVGPCLQGHPPHATCGNRACFNPEHLEPKAWREAKPLVTCRLCGAQKPREEMRHEPDAGHYSCLSHRRDPKETKRKHDEAKAAAAVQREQRRALASHMPETVEELMAALQWDVSETECWVNVRGKGVHRDNYSGYYSFNKGKHRDGLHRLVFALSEQRPLESGEQTMHKCDNPECINPEHLFAGTRSDNTQDMMDKGREDRSGKRVLTEDQVFAILDSTESSYVLAPRFGLTPTQIRRVKSGARWRDVYARWQATRASA